MCCGCVSVIGNAIGNTLYVLERIASCCAFTALVTCIIASLTIILGFGIGLGYNYCLVEVKTSKAGSGSSTPESAPVTTVTEITGDIISSPSNTTNTTTKPSDRLFRRFDFSEHFISPMKRNTGTTMSIPINSAVDFLGLISKIRTFKKPVTLELLV